MIDKVLAGIMTKFSGSAFATAIGSRMYSRYVPQLAVFPYAVLALPITSHDWNYSDQFEEVDVQISAFSTSGNEVEINDILTKALALYDDCTLAVTGYTSVYMQRESIHALGDGENGVRQFTILYNLLIEK